jgi:hypothetical protein
MDVEGIRYFTKPMLRELNDNARLTGAVNYINPLLFENYAEDTCLPIDYFEFHGDVVTAAVFLNPEGDIGYLDMPVTFFETIPTLDMQPHVLETATASASVALH